MLSASLNKIFSSFLPFFFNIDRVLFLDRSWSFPGKKKKKKKKKEEEEKEEEIKKRKKEMDPLTSPLTCQTSATLLD